MLEKALALSLQQGEPDTVAGMPASDAGLQRSISDAYDR